MLLRNDTVAVCDNGYDERGRGAIDVQGCERNERWQDLSFSSHSNECPPDYVHLRLKATQFAWPSLLTVLLCILIYQFTGSMATTNIFRGLEGTWKHKGL